MRNTTIAAILLAAALPITACSSSDDGAKPAASKSTAASKTASSPAAAADLALGKAAQTTGDGGTGILEVTPTTVVYSKDGGGETPENGLFAVVTIKDRPTTAVAAAEAPPISGGGWQWIAPDGQAIDEGNGAAFNVVMDAFNFGGKIQPGSFKWGAKVFDLSDKQRGGTLIYTDGEGAAHRWTMPAADAGPQIAQVAKALKF